MAASDLVSGAEAVEAFVGFIRRQFPVIVFVTLLALVLGVTYLVTARPSFTAHAQLLIDGHKLNIFQQRSVLGDVPIDTARVESQVEVLKSEEVASAVIRKFHLTQDPEFVGPKDSLLGALFKAVFAVFNNNTGSDRTTPSDFALFRSAMDTFQDRLSVKRIGLTYVIEIGFRSFDAERAARIANAVADGYIDDQLEAKYSATRRASAWLLDRIKALRDQASTAERAVVDFTTKNNIVSTGGNDKRLVGQQEVAELNSQLVIARAHAAEAKARLERINSVLKADSPSDLFGETVADTLKNQVVSKLRSQYLELAGREAEWSRKYGRNHLAVVNLRNQMREIRNSIFQELKRLGETYKSDYEIAKQRQIGIEKDLARAVSKSQATDTKSVTLHELQSTAETYKTIYDNFLQRYMETVQQQSFPISEARVISRATRPSSPSHPKKKLLLAIVGLGGLILGLGIGLLRDLLERVFRTSDQIENLLQLPCIGVVPLLVGDGSNLKSGTTKRAEKLASAKADPRDQSNYKMAGRKDLSQPGETIPKGGDLPTSRSRFTRTQPEGERTIVYDDSVLWTMYNAPFSRFAEEIRSVKLAVDLNGITKAGHVIGFTSSIPNEGKSTLASSLVQLTSQIGARSILIDCDLRNPSLTRALSPNATFGMLEVLAGEASLDDTIWTEPTTKMAFLPMVTKSRVAHSSEILRSDQTKKLVEQLRERYDYVVLDFPPLAPVIDVRTTSHLVDGFVFVIAWGRTKIDVVQHALASASPISENLFGVVLNGVKMDLLRRHVSHNYYHNKHYAQYGYTE